MAVKENGALGARDPAITEEGRESPVIHGGDELPPCLTDICSSEYAVLCGEQEAGEQKATADAL